MNPTIAAKTVVRDTATVGVVDGDIDVAAVIKQPVDDVRRLAFDTEITLVWNGA